MEEAAVSLAKFFRARTGLVDEVVDRAPWEDDPAGLAEILAYALLNRSPRDFASLERKLSPEASARQLEQALDEITFAVSPEAALFRAYDPFDLVAAALGEGGASDLIQPAPPQRV